MNKYYCWQYFFTFVWTLLNLHENTETTYVSTHSELWFSINIMSSFIILTYELNFNWFEVTCAPNVTQGGSMLVRQPSRILGFYSSDCWCGTPKGQAERPEKPAAWDYYAQRGASSSSLPSSSHKHTNSHRNLTQRHFSLFLNSFVPSCLFFTCGTFTLTAPGTSSHVEICAPVDSSYLPDLLWLSAVHRWTMPPSDSWGRGRRSAQAPIWRKLEL